MRCKQCGHENKEPVQFQPVMRALAWVDITKAAYEDEPAYKRWACRSCGRYHFPDGSLYSNPYSREKAKPT